MYDDIQDILRFCAMNGRTISLRNDSLFYIAYYDHMSQNWSIYSSVPVVREPEWSSVHPPLSSPIFWRELWDYTINFYVNTFGNWGNRVEIAIFGFFDPKIYLLHFQSPCPFPVLIGLTFGSKSFFLHFLTKIFRKNHVFYCFAPNLPKKVVWGSFFTNFFV